MKDPNIETKVIHSESKDAWNVVGDVPGAKYKVARVPYLVIKSEVADTMAKSNALQHALFISQCFNNSSRILKLLK